MGVVPAPRIRSVGTRCGNSLRHQHGPNVPQRSAASHAKGGRVNRFHLGQENSMSVRKENTLQLVLGTGAFAFCFAVFGSVSAMMPILRKQMGLTPIQVSLAIALPVL